MATADQVNQHSRVEEELRESELRFREVAEHMREVFWMRNAEDFSFLYLSPVFEEIWGRPRQTLYNCADEWLDAIHPVDRQRVCHAFFEKVTEDEYLAEFRIVRPDGSIRWISDRGFTIRSPSGEVYRVGGIAEDISQRKSSERQRRELQAELAHMGRLSTMGEMATGLAHELNQPLAAISNYAAASVNRLRKGNGSQDGLIANLEQVSHQALRASHIIRQMRNLVRKTKPRHAKVLVGQLVQEVLDLVESDLRHYQIHLRLNLDPQLPPVWTDSIQMQQVILNLTRNSIEAMVEVVDGPHELSIAALPTDGHVEISVCDTGKGLDLKMDEQLFEPFFSTKTTGLGMGLSISRSIVEAHGGRLWGQANSQRGATFRFTLPIARKGQVDDA
ncbi:MAG: PAS domain-containing protein [Planctomycetota bacterium]|nr:PAS domain-containing protein [Planctomycetota bacterium]